MSKESLLKDSNDDKKSKIDISNDDVIKDDDFLEDDVLCNVNRFMIPAKMAYLFKMAMYDISTFSMMFYVAIGFTPSDAGLIKGVQYIGGLLGAPLWGVVADKMRCYKFLAMAVCCLAMVTMASQPFVSLAVGGTQHNRCPLRVGNKTELHSVMRTHSTSKRYFFTMLAVAAIASFFDAGLMSYVDSGVIRRILSSPTKSNYGKQRYIGSIGTGLGAVSNSLAITYFPHIQMSCYTGLFITYFVYGICLAVALYFLFDAPTVSNENDSTNDVLEDVISTLRSFDTIFFLINVLFNGIAQAVLYSFVYLYLQDLGAPTMLFGLSMSVAATSAGIVYNYSHSIITFLGGPMIAISVSWVAWTIKYFFLAFLQNPYLVLIADLLQGVTYGLYRSASLQHSCVVSNPKIIMSMCGIINALHNPCGFFIANVAGGVIYSTYGGSALFFVTANMCLACSVLTILYEMAKRIRKN